MKITKEYLQKVIKEEVDNLLQEEEKVTSDVATAKKKLDTLPQLRRLLAKVDRRVEALEMLDVFLSMMSDKLDPKEIKRVLQMKIQKM
tara:strand:+ start:154 stop:417 length:264 start_codon:yes stop_codon:yes gene_type:complete